MSLYGIEQDYNQIPNKNFVIEALTEFPTGAADGRIIKRSDLNQLYIKLAGNWIRLDNAGVSEVGHNHDDRYYTEAEINTFLENTANLHHTHPISDIDSLQETLDDLPTSAEMSAAISTAVNNLINGAPGALDALNELAAALGNNPNFASDILAALANKADLHHTHDMSDVADLETHFITISDRLAITPVTEGGSLGALVAGTPKAFGPANQGGIISARFTRNSDDREIVLQTYQTQVGGIRRYYVRSALDFADGDLNFTLCYAKTFGY